MAARKHRAARIAFAQRNLMRNSLLRTGPSFAVLNGIFSRSLRIQREDCRGLDKLLHSRRRQAIRRFKSRCLVAVSLDSPKKYEKFIELVKTP